MLKLYMYAWSDIISANQLSWDAGQWLSATAQRLPSMLKVDSLSARLKRFTDVLLGTCLFGAFGFLMLAVAGLIRLTSKGPVLYWSNRVGRSNRFFRMPKFRTMREGTPAVATHLLAHPQSWLTPIGRILRKLSIDELPQLYSVIKGDMSMVGPRPALFNQDDLVASRTEKGIHRIVPGITGWAQVNGRDELSIPEKVKFDEFYLQHRSFGFDMQILGLTLLQVIKRRGLSH